MLSSLTSEKIKELELKANDIRKSIIEMLLYAGSGHTAGPLGMADVFTLFYFHILKHDPKNPNWEGRDIVVLSNGHICPVLYATMAHSGYFPVSELKTLRKFGSRLQGHPHREYLPMLETSSGPLGCGLSQACGMALSLKMDKTEDRFVYAFISDGELDEGNTWEGILFAGKNKLDNLIVVLDRNNIQIDGNTEDVMPLEPLASKMKSFNFHVAEVSGHDLESFDKTVQEIKKIKNKPKIIITHTIPGKGVHEFEANYKWHGYDPVAENAKEDYKNALNELRTLGGKIKSENQ